MKKDVRDKNTKKSFGSSVKTKESADTHYLSQQKKSLLSNLQNICGYCNNTQIVWTLNSGPLKIDKGFIQGWAKNTS